MSFEGNKARFNIKNAVKHGVITGLMGWAAIEGVQAYQPNAHQIFAERGSHTQFYSGDVGFGTHADRPNAVDVTYRGRSVAAIPSSSFGQPQSGEHNIRRSDRWSAQHTRAERTSESSQTQAVDNGAPSYVHIDSMPNVSTMVTAPVILESSTPTPVAQIPPWLPFVAFAPEAIYGVGTTLNKTLIHSGSLQSRLNSFETLSLEARLLAACAVPLTTIAPTESQQAPLTATAAPEVTGTPLVNEVLTSTPAPRIEVPVGSGEYPTAVSMVDSPKVYSYGGPEGRENMDEVTRAMFDRYIAELAREGKIQGSTPEALYLDFDKTFDFKMFVTDQMLTRIIQYKSGGAYLVPENMVGQVYRELQLSYNDLFQGGAAVDVGTDNFGFRQFQADRVGGVGAWPVFVNVDAQSIPVSWLNMERGGAEIPIQVVNAGVTATAESPVSINVSPEIQAILVAEHAVGADGKLVTKLTHGESAKQVDIQTESIKTTHSEDSSVTDIITGTDAVGNRYIWNTEISSWVPEFQLSQDYTHPENATYVEYSAFKDGSMNLSAALYVAEHPELLSDNPTHPYYKINVFLNPAFGGFYYQISLFRAEPYRFTDPEETAFPLQKDTIPFTPLGLVYSKDTQGNVFEVIAQNYSNPSLDNPERLTNVFFGIDQPTYTKYSTDKADNGLSTIENIVLHYTSELSPMFPPPTGHYWYDPAQFRLATQETNPVVANLQSPNLIKIFTPEEQKLITDIFVLWEAGTAPDAQHSSVAIGELPPELSDMVVFTGFQGWFMAVE